MFAIANGLALHGGFMPYDGHVPHVLRLRAQRAAHGGADEAAARLRVHARLDRPRRGRTDAPVDRARVEPAADPAARRLAPVRHRRDRGRLGRGDRARRRADARCCSRARTWRSRRATRADRDDPSRRLRARRLRRATAGARWSSRPARRCRSRCRRAMRSPPKASPCASSRCRARNVFDRQDAAYRAIVLPTGVPRVAVEAGVTGLLAQVRRRRRRSARRGRRHRHASASRRPPRALFKHFGFTVEQRRRCRACGVS